MPERPGELERRLRDRLGGFCRYLRLRGYPVGIGAELDLVRASGTFDLLDRAALKNASGVALARSPEELGFVGEAFDRYWSLDPAAAEAPPAAHEIYALAPPRPSEKRDRPRPEGEVEVERPPVAIPLGTYSAAAPATGHALRTVAGREMRAVRHGARRFRRKLATLPGRRHAPAHRGAVDLRSTVRQSLHHGGEWIELRREAPRISRAEFVILWDVSGSMREHETRLFAIVHALLALSRRSRVFAFSTRLEDVTGLVRQHGYRRAAEVIGRRIDRADGGTRIGRALAEFSERYGSTLGPTSTLLLLSDGWDLGEAELVREELSHLGRRARWVAWLTPYTRRPGFEPSVGALRAARREIDLLLGPEDFEAHWPPRPFPL